MRLTCWLQILKHRRQWPPGRPTANWANVVAFGRPRSDGRSSSRRLRQFAPWRHRLPTRRPVGNGRGVSVQPLT
ncbi:MAG: hypothetical protein QF363_07470 [Planctomycetaceae bacterium]|nr:hypothetical protein [Planctomycetaceae bacterium]